MQRNLVGIFFSLLLRRRRRRRRSLAFTRDNNIYFRSPLFGSGAYVLVFIFHFDRIAAVSMFVVFSFCVCVFLRSLLSTDYTNCISLMSFIFAAPKQ